MDLRDRLARRLGQRSDLSLHPHHNRHRNHGCGRRHLLQPSIGQRSGRWLLEIRTDRHSHSSMSSMSNHDRGRPGSPSGAEEAVVAGRLRCSFW
jgi:hypothetical protein